MNKIKFFLILIFLSPVLILISCDDKVYKMWRKAQKLEKKHRKCVQYGKENVKVIKQFNEVYPNAENFIGAFGSRRKTDWNSVIGLHGRYELSMKIPVKLNKDRTKFTVIGDPQFQLVENTSIKKREDGGLSVSVNSESQRDFGIKKWKEIYEKDGSLSPLNLKIKKNQPLKHFGELWKLDE